MILTLRKPLNLNLPTPQISDNLEIANGLIWIPELLAPIQQQRLLKYIYATPGQTPLNLPSHHRQQCYGWVEKPTYDLSRLTRKRDDLGAMPDWLNAVRRRLRPWMRRCDQIVVCTTMAVCPLTCPSDRTLHTLAPGFHLDHSKNFGNAIATIALSPLKMLFRRGMREPIAVELDAGDALIMQDEIRYQWLHQFVFDEKISQTFLTVRSVNHL
jgi:hypothetical protein